MKLGKSLIKVKIESERRSFLFSGCAESKKKIKTERLEKMGINIDMVKIRKQEAVAYYFLGVSTFTERKRKTRYNREDERQG